MGSQPLRQALVPCGLSADVQRREPLLTSPSRPGLPRASWEFPPGWGVEGFLSRSPAPHPLSLSCSAGGCVYV